MSRLLMLGCWGANAAAGLAAGFHGVQLKKSGDETAANYQGAHTAISFDTTVFDTDTFYAGGSQTRITIPSSLNGYYVQLTANVQIDSLGANETCSLIITKGGTVYDGIGLAGRDSGAGVDGTSTRHFAQARTHPILVSTGDYFEAKLRIEADTSVTIEADNTFFDLHVIGSSVIGALVKNSADLTTQNYSASPNIGWNTDVYDTDAFHDTGSNTSRLTVPVTYNGRYAIIKGTTRLNLVANNGETNATIKRNGSTFATGPVMAIKMGDDLVSFIDIETAPIVVSTGDYFEFTQFAEDTSTTLDAAYSSFSIRILPASFQGALCKLNANATANYTTATALAWDGTDIYDTDAAHDPSSNNTKIIVPSAWNGKYGILRAAVTGSGLAANEAVSLAFYKGGTTVFDGFGGYGGFLSRFASQPYLSAHSCIVQLATGNEFEVKFWNNSDTSVTIASAQAWFGLEVLSEL